MAEIRPACARCSTNCCNVSMDRVEFFIDDESFGFSTVAPYTRKWTIKMIDRPPVWSRPVTEIREVTNPDGSKSQVEVTISDVITRPNGGLMRRFANGMWIIQDTGGYTESHVIQVVAYDSAGNSNESAKVRIFITNKTPRTSLLIPDDQIPTTYASYVQTSLREPQDGSDVREGRPSLLSFRGALSAARIDKRGDAFSAHVSDLPSTLFARSATVAASLHSSATILPTFLSLPLARPS